MTAPMLVWVPTPVIATWWALRRPGSCGSGNAGRDLACVPGPIGQGARYGTGRIDDGGPDVVGLHLGKEGGVGKRARGRASSTQGAQEKERRSHSHKRQPGPPEVRWRRRWRRGFLRLAARGGRVESLGVPGAHCATLPEMDTT